MNRVHGAICSSGWWARTVERKLLPWGLRDVDLGDAVLEIGPGFGATTRVLARRPGSLSVLELEQRYCERLRRRLGEDVLIVQGDATEMPFPDESYSGVVCFTMLHHLPSSEAQDKLLAEASRVLAPGGVLAGTDSIGTGTLFKLLHVGDTLVPVNPASLPERLERAGLAEARVEPSGGSFRFRARKPVPIGDRRDLRSASTRATEDSWSGQQPARQSHPPPDVRGSSRSRTQGAWRAMHASDRGR